MTAKTAGKVNADTEKLIRECGSGTKMAVKSIDEVLDGVKDGELKKLLLKSKEEHDSLKDGIKGLLEKYALEEKEPDTMAEAMSWLKINVKMMASGSDKTIAGLMSEGCAMGIRSICGFINECQKAEDEAKDTAKRLVELESALERDLRKFL